MFDKYSVTSGVLVERVGDDVMVVVPGNNDFIKLSGEAADVLLRVQAGHTMLGSETVLSELEELGVVTGAGMSRRGLIKAGAIGAGTGIAVMAMPSVAAASSDVGERISGVYFWIGSEVLFVLDERNYENFDLTLSAPFFPTPLPSSDVNDVSRLTLTTSVAGLGTLEVREFQFSPAGERFLVWEATLAGGEGALPTETLEGFFTWDTETIYASFTRVNLPPDV